MSKYWKSRTYLKRGLVRLQGKSDRFLFFEVGKYCVRLPRTKDQKFNCTCQSGSIWRVGKECSHIKAARLWLEGGEL